MKRDRFNLPAALPGYESRVKSCARNSRPFSRFRHQVLGSYRLSSDGMFDPFEVLAVGALRSRVGKSSKDVQRLAGVPIGRIQLLIGHKNKSTTEIYIKQRWRETAQPNMVSCEGPR